jgi:hypothetical protein
MTISNERLQHVLDMCANYSDEEVSAKLGKKVDTIRRYKDEARKRGLKSVEEHVKLPSIFIMDIENAPTTAAVWGMWKQNINLAAIKEEWYLLSWSGKYLFDTTMYADVLTPDEAKSGNDKRVMESLWHHLDSCDIVVGHNMQQFDVLKANTRFILNGMMPPSPYQVIDTLLAARKNFAFTSNKLDYLCKQFGVEGKADNGGMQRWMGCMEGNAQDLLDMEEYNKQDIIATEELYLAMRPYIKNHPNLALYMDNEREACYKCGSPNLEWPEGKFYYTTVNKFSVYRCQECGSHGRSRKTAVSKQESQYITSPIAR